MVERFQAGEAGAFVISLKAGGTGLNLTRATHVVHYDRWWNPAVEDQASDRAWRIGQDRPVQVHRLICEGTVEERIATLLADKRDLAEAVVGAGEAWLSELDDDELAELVELSRRRRWPDGRAAGVRHHVVGEGVDRRARAAGPPRHQPPAPGPHLRPPGPGRTTSSSARARSRPGAGQPARAVHVRVHIRRFSDDEWERRAGRDPARAAHTAALLDGELDPGIVEDARAVGVELLPGAGELGPAAPAPTGPTPASTQPPSATWWPTSSTPIPSPSSSCGAGPGTRSWPSSAGVGPPAPVLDRRRHSPCPRSIEASPPARRGPGC